ncbi:MAG: hypothetical protein MZW92_76980 [Comamonadaceae bacterium]|nr:hypothetical protein [Comamonadaceae bacterium]
MVIAAVASIGAAAGRADDPAALPRGRAAATRRWRCTSTALVPEFLHALHRLAAGPFRLSPGQARPRAYPGGGRGGAGRATTSASSTRW